METESPLDHLPREPEEISREWLFAVINQYRRARDLSLLRHPDDILDCSIDECQSSHGYLSTTYKLLAHFQCENPLGSEDCSYAFFLKMLPGVGEKYQKLVLSTQVFRREIEAQFHLLPLLKQFVDHQNLKASFVPSPEIVYGSYDEAEGDGIIVLMDLNERGFHPLNHYFGLNLGQLEKVVEQLAEFHASGSAMLLQEENAATKFKMFHSDNQNNRQNIYESLYPHYRDFAKFLRRVPGYYHCFHKVDQLRPNLVPIMTKSETRKSRFPLKTIVHGELWDKNILMRFEQLTQSLEVVFTDWKDLSIGSPCQDLAFLMLACTSKNLRVKHKNQILRKYFQTYCNVLRKFNIKLSTYDVGFTVQEPLTPYSPKSCSPTASSPARTAIFLMLVCGLASISQATPIRNSPLSFLLWPPLPLLLVSDLPSCLSFLTLSTRLHHLLDSHSRGEEIEDATPLGLHLPEN
eukprot:maker-scaffold167_size293163-snap-gene-0.9 protein:Tk08574 transcript:maker-scaffold167_size293163-snap-gene-0.9-mRNA-1 annotation:"uncharacterized oxidoreductase dhs-27-like"